MPTEVVTALVAGLGALGGVLIGKRLDRGQERRRWLRDAKAKASVDYVTAFQTMRQILRAIATSDPGSVEYEEARKARRTHWATYSAAVVALELYGDPAVYAAVLEVDKDLRRFSADLASSAEDFDTTRWHTGRKPVDEKMRSYIDIVRRDLGLEPHVTDRQAWVTSSPSLRAGGTKRAEDGTGEGQSVGG